MLSCASCAIHTELWNHNHQVSPTCPHIKKQNRPDTQNSLLLEPACICNRVMGTELSPFITLHFNETSGHGRWNLGGIVPLKIHEMQRLGETGSLVPLDDH